MEDQPARWLHQLRARSNRPREWDRRPKPLRTGFWIEFGLWLLAGLLLLAAVTYGLWWGLGKPELRGGTLAPKDRLELLKIGLATVAGVGGLVALVVNRRKQHVAEETNAREDTQLFDERFGRALEQLGAEQAAVRLGGVYAMANLADDWKAGRQQCIDVLCAYLRMPYTPPVENPAGGGAREPDDVDHQEKWHPTQQQRAQERQVRHTVIRVITDHLRVTPSDPRSWHGYRFDFTGATFDGGDFSGITVSDGTLLRFTGARFVEGAVNFAKARFAGGKIDFRGAVVSAGKIDFYRAKFSGSSVDFVAIEVSGGELAFNGARFRRGMLRFERAALDRAKVHLANAEFRGATLSFDCAKFTKSELVFNGATFDGGTLTFDPGLRLSVNKAASLRCAVFEDSKVFFRDATFVSGVVGFRNAQFSRSEVSFDHATFGSAEPASDELVVAFTRAAFVTGGAVYVPDYPKFEHSRIHFDDVKLRRGRFDFDVVQFTHSEVCFYRAEFGARGARHHGPILRFGQKVISTDGVLLADTTRFDRSVVHFEDVTLHGAVRHLTARNSPAARSSSTASSSMMVG